MSKEKELVVWDGMRRAWVFQDGASEEGRHFEFRDLSTEIPVVALLLSFLSLESFY